MSTNPRIVFHAYGKPADVLAFEEGAVPQPAAGEVLVRVRAAPIHPADFFRIDGRYGAPPPLPAVGGMEGTGEIAACGPGAGERQPGERVSFQTASGSWQRYVVLPASEAFPLPKDLLWEQAAMALINPPTAFLMLRDFASLQPGDWIAQNAATSAVGRLVIQLARLRGWRTANLLRDPARAGELEAAGADLVLPDDDTAPKRARSAIDGPMRLALDAVGGPSSLRLLEMLAESGTIITFGAMSREPIPFFSRHLIFRDIRWRGFWVHHWWTHARPEQRAAVVGEVFPLLGSGRLSSPIAQVYPLAEYKAALQHARQGGRPGKILLAVE